jgi:hypothetical protein
MSLAGKRLSEFHSTGFDPNSPTNEAKLYGAFSDYVDKQKDTIDQYIRSSEFNKNYKELCNLIQILLTNETIPDDDFSDNGFTRQNIASEIQKLNNQLKKINFYYELEGKIYDPSIRKMTSGVFGKTTDYKPIKQTFDNLHDLLFQLTNRFNVSRNLGINIMSNEKFFAMLKKCAEENTNTNTNIEETEYLLPAGGRKKSRKSRKSRKSKKSRKSRK